MAKAIKSNGAHAALCTVGRWSINLLRRRRWTSVSIILMRLRQRKRGSGRGRVTGMVTGQWSHYDAPQSNWQFISFVSGNSQPRVGGCAMCNEAGRTRGKGPLLTSCVGDAILNNFNNLLGNLRLTRRTRQNNKIKNNKLVRFYRECEGETPPQEQ